MKEIRQNQHLHEFNAIGHVFWDGEYQDSYPLYRESLKEAKKIFKTLGWYDKAVWWFDRMVAPKTTVEVDGIKRFLFNEGAITMEEFQEYWGIDVVTWIWGAGPVPEDIRKLIGDTWERRFETPSVVPSMEERERFQEFYENYMTSGKNLLRSIEKSVANHADNISRIFWSMATRFGNELRPEPDRKTILTMIIEVLKRGSYWRDDSDK